MSRVSGSARDTFLIGFHKMGLTLYRKQRDDLLSEIVTTISNDERFVAAWLTGSLGKNEADDVSDIDLNLVIADGFSPSLCARTEQVSASTSPERFALFSQFGSPALIHENNNNAPEGGTMTFVLYANSALMVDWVLIPQSKAARPNESKLLFDKVGIHLEPAPEIESLESRKKSVSESWAFFWMMTAVTVKYIVRNDGVFVAKWIEFLHSLILDIERKIKGVPWVYVRGSITQLESTREKQIESIRRLSTKMLELQPKVTQFTENKIVTPFAEIETLLSLIE